MRNALTSIAGTEHVHEITINLTSAMGGTIGVALIKSLVDEAFDKACEIASAGYVADCPACLANRCLERIDEAETREGGLL